MASEGKTAKAAQVSNIIAGTKKRLPNGNQSITIGGVTMTVDQATAKLQTFVDNRDTVETAQASVKAAVATEKAQEPSLLAFIADYVTFIRLQFGNAADVLADFDIPPRKAPVPQTAEQKAVAVAKRNATREARGTSGKKAKQSVKGNVTAKIVVTPSTPAAGGGTTPTTHG
jgi:hypothetical protein